MIENSGSTILGATPANISVAPRTPLEHTFAWSLLADMHAGGISMNFRLLSLAAAGIVMFASGQTAPTPAGPQYPLAMKTRWTYAMRQEFGPGVHPSAEKAALLKGNVLETTLVSEVAGSDLIGGLKYTRVESRQDGRLWMTEWLRLTPEGLFLGKTNEDGKETVITPPQKIMSPRMTVGEEWNWKASNAPVSIKTRVSGKEAADVPAGKFDAIKSVHELSMVLPQATIRSTNRRWLSPGLGYVQQESEVYAGDQFLTRTQLRLMAFDGEKSAAPK
jgi:hypothetical protein